MKLERQMKDGGLYVEFGHKDPEDVAYLNSPCSGIFLKKREHCAFVHAGEEIGSILNPFLGEETASILAPETGLLFTIREYPVVDEGSLLARIIKMEVPEV